ncbi:hypothetical protein Tsubulata_005860 [Turnera subulata]|uniref:Uncharacterized protein n=1 Tax=Turnera subulata TaxID=218843 RepID=A0A9Q0G4F1_9ROSI|nr:hypothetical protein Tsubulata_005860 [Turnera subulata]
MESESEKEEEAEEEEFVCKPRKKLKKSKNSRKRRSRASLDLESRQKPKKIPRKVDLFVKLGFDPAPDHSLEIRERIMVEGDTDLKLVLNKQLFDTDTNTHHDRFSMPKGQILDFHNFLTQEEEWKIIVKKESVPVKLVDPGKNFGTVSEVYSFRREGQLWFVLKMLRVPGLNDEDLMMITSTGREREFSDELPLKKMMGKILARITIEMD